MLVDESRRLALAKDVDRGALVAARSAEHGEARSRNEPRAIRRREVGGDRLAGAAGERRADPAAELVPLLVVEPPDVLTRGIEPARDAEPRAFRAIGDLTMPIRPAIPRVDLETSARVREIDEPIGFIPRPCRESKPRRAVATLPRDLGRGKGLGDRHEYRVYLRTRIATRRRWLKTDRTSDQDLTGPGVGFQALDKGRKTMGKFDDTSRKLADAMTKHNLDALANLYATDTVAYDPMYPEPLRGREAIRKDTAIFFRAFPDLRFEIVTVIEKDEKTGAGELRMTGTHTGPLESPTGQEIPPTNKRIDLKGAVFARVNDRGEIVEERRYYDVGTLLRQLGLVPEQSTEPVGAQR